MIIHWIADIMTKTFCPKCFGTGTRMTNWDGYDSEHYECTECAGNGEVEYVDKSDECCGQGCCH